VATATRRAARERIPKVNIQDMEDYTESQNWLLYGPTGSGKTPWASQQPRTLIIACDSSGWVSAKRAGSRAKITRVYQWADFEAIYHHLRRNPSAYDWVIIDTITMAQTRLLRAILELEHKRSPAKRSLYIPAIQDHQLWQNMLKNMVTDFNELPFNTVWTAQEMTRENGEGDPIVWPLLPGGKEGYEMASWLCSQMDVVARIGVSMRRKGGNVRPVRAVLMESRPPYEPCRDRFGVLPKSAVIRDGDENRVTMQELTKLIAEAPPEAKERAAKRVATRSSKIELDDSSITDAASARPTRQRRRRAA
jgi:hypothetical protein